MVWSRKGEKQWYYNDVLMSALTTQITGVMMVCSTVCSGADQRKHRCSASPAFVRRIHRWPVNSPHKGSITQKMFPFGDVIMTTNNYHPSQWPRLTRVNMLLMQSGSYSSSSTSAIFIPNLPWSHICHWYGIIILCSFHPQRHIVIRFLEASSQPQLVRQQDLLLISRRSSSA